MRQHFGLVSPACPFRGEAGRGAALRGCKLSLLRPPSSVLLFPEGSVPLRSVPFLSSLSSREEGEEGKQHTRLPC